MPNEEAVGEQQEQVQEKKKTFLPKVIILAVLAALLGAGGYFGWVKFLKKPPPEINNETPKASQVVRQEMGTFLVNLADPGGKRYLKLGMQAELDNAQVVKEITERNIEVRDAVLMLLSSREYEEIGTLSGKLALKQDLITRINRLLRTGQVKEVYFTEFLVQ